MAWSTQAQVPILVPFAVTTPSLPPSTPARYSPVIVCQSPAIPVAPCISPRGHTSPLVSLSPPRAQLHLPAKHSPPKATYSPPRFQNARRPASSTPTNLPHSSHRRATTSSLLKSSPPAAQQTPLSRKQRARMGMLFGEDGCPSPTKRSHSTKFPPPASSSPPTGISTRFRSQSGTILNKPAVSRPIKPAKPLGRRAWI